MRVLAVDATSGRLSLALTDGGRVWRRRVQVGTRHDEKIFAETRRLLARAGWRLDDLEAFVAASGPGSFTGVRVGMTFVAMLARTLGRPAVAVTLFEAEAFRTAAALPVADRRVLGVVFPARRPALRSADRLTRGNAPGARDVEFFFQAFERTGRLKRPVVRSLGAPQWLTLSLWPKALARAAGGRRRAGLCARHRAKGCAPCARRVLLVGPGAREAAEGLSGSRFRVDVREEGAVGAEGLVPSALERLSGGEPGEFAPLYLKPAYYERMAH